MSLTRKRIVAAIYLVVLLLAIGNHYLSWGLTGTLDKKILALVTFVGVICMALFGERMLQEIREYRAKQKLQRQNENGT